MQTSFVNTKINHNAGLDGFGGSSMLDGVICRYKDSTSVFAHASDGVLEEKVYICQNFRGDVSAIVTSDGKMKEWVKYSAYGIPFAMPAGDADSDGDCDTNDVGQILTWKNGNVYDVRGDLDLDGDIDATDRTTAIGSYQGTTLGWGILSNIGNRKGYAGYERDINFGKTWHVRNRVLDSELGRWTRRDPLGYVDSDNLYEYVKSIVIRSFDPLGQLSLRNVGGGGVGPGHGGAMINLVSPVTGDIGFPSPINEIETDSECCQFAAQSTQGMRPKPMTDSGGFVACCSDKVTGEQKLTPCVGLPYKNASKEIQDCILLHESMHIVQDALLSPLAPIYKECHGDATSAEENVTPTPPGVEVGPSKAELSCLTAYYKKKNHACNDVNCLMDIDEVLDRIDTVYEYYSKKTISAGAGTPLPKTSFY